MFAFWLCHKLTFEEKKVKCCPSWDTSAGKIHDFPLDLEVLMFTSRKSPELQEVPEPEIWKGLWKVTDILKPGVTITNQLQFRPGW